MIFTSRFGALAARPNFRKENEQKNAELQLDREIDELLTTADLESADDHRN